MDQKDRFKLLIINMFTTFQMFSNHVKKKSKVSTITIKKLMITKMKYLDNYEHLTILELVPCIQILTQPPAAKHKRCVTTDDYGQVYQTILERLPPVNGYQEQILEGLTIKTSD